MTAATVNTQQQDRNTHTHTHTSTECDTQQQGQKNPTRGATGAGEPSGRVRQTL